MYFDSLHAILDMDGHGAFVWSAYGISLTVIAVLLVAPYRRRKRLLAGIRAGQRRQGAAGPRQADGVSTKEESLNAPGA